MHEIGKFLKEKNIDIIISPDKGGIERAKTAAIAADCDFDYLEKKRLDGHTVEMKPLKSEVVGLNVALVDDIISTGGTIVTATRQLKDRGAKSVYAVCTHGLFIGDAFERLRGVCNDVIATDTLITPATCVSVAPEIAKTIKEFF
jgi:ribose-phosphate pyrophosphokinase